MGVWSGDHNPLTGTNMLTGANSDSKGFINPLTGAPNRFPGRKKTPDSTFASDTYAQITRDQWSTYVSTFMPIENEMIRYATNAALPGQEMAQASQDVNKAFESQQGATARRLAGQGVTLSADEQGAQAKSYGLAKSLADVNAQNVAGAATRQRQESVIGNPVPSGTGG